MSNPVKRRVYVISDLHLGGAPDSHPVNLSETGAPDPPKFTGRGFRIFTRTRELTSFVEAIGKQSADGEAVELVINGDFVDLLAEVDPVTKGWTAIKTPQAAEQAFLAIAGPDREGPVFDALATFLAAGHRLTVLIGNHDVEMSFPAVRMALERRLAARGRDYSFFYDGEAYAIGDVLIEHGNRYDSFNINDYDALRRCRSLLSRRESVPLDFWPQANAGSELVASVVNLLKVDYPFIDLLKPEAEAVLPVLLSIEPSCRRHLLQVLWASRRSASRGMRSPLVPKQTGDIRASAASEQAGGDADMGGLPPAAGDFDPLADIVKGRLGAARATEFVRAIVESTGPPVNLLEEDITALRDRATTALGLLKLLTQYDGSLLQRRLPALLQALRGLHSVDAFHPHKEPPGPYLDAITRLGANGFRLILFGHTHVVRDVNLGQVRYLNTGTWADFLRFPNDMLYPPDSQAIKKLEQFVRALRDRRSFEVALAAGSLGVHLDFQPTFARLELTADGRLDGADLRTFTGPSSV